MPNWFDCHPWAEAMLIFVKVKQINKYVKIFETMQ